MHLSVLMRTPYLTALHCNFLSLSLYLLAVNLAFFCVLWAEPLLSSLARALKKVFLALLIHVEVQFFFNNMQLRLFPTFLSGGSSRFCLCCKSSLGWPWPHCQTHLTTHIWPQGQIFPYFFFLSLYWSMSLLQLLGADLSVHLKGMKFSQQVSCISLNQRVWWEIAGQIISLYTREK